MNKIYIFLTQCWGLQQFIKLQELMTSPIKSSHLVLLKSTLKMGQAILTSTVSSFPESGEISCSVSSIYAMPC